MLTELQKIGLIYESANEQIQYSDLLRQAGFKSSFVDLPQTPPRGFWVAWNSMFLPCPRDHSIALVSLLELVGFDFEEDLMTAYLFKTLKLIRIAVGDYDQETLFWESHADNIPRSAIKTIEDIAQFYDLPCERDENDDQDDAPLNER